MAKYKLNIAHNNIHEEISYSEAIDLINNYDKHRVGQPLAIIYYDEFGNRQLLFAIGKRDFTDPLEDGSITGEQFYEIINREDIRGEETSFIIVKDGEVYIRGFKNTGEKYDYKILNDRSIDQEEDPESIVTLGYLDSWGTFQTIEDF